MEVAILHIVVALLGLSLLIANRASKRESRASQAIAAFMSIVAIAGLGYGAQYLRDSWHNHHRITNPQMPPSAMNDEGDGPPGRFFPSSAQVYGQQKIPVSSSWTRIPASPATRTSTSNGKARCTTLLRSTTSGIAKHRVHAGSRWASSRRNGAAAATIRRCFTGLMDTPIRRSCTARGAGGPGLHVVPLHRAGEEHDGAGDFYRISRSTSLPPARTRSCESLHDFAIKLNPKPHRKFS